MSASAGPEFRWARARPGILLPGTFLAGSSRTVLSTLVKHPCPPGGGGDVGHANHIMYEEPIQHTGPSIQ